MTNFIQSGFDFLISNQEKLLLFLLLLSLYKG